MENQLKRPPTISSKDSSPRSTGFSKGRAYCTLCKCTHSKAGWPLCLVTRAASTHSSSSHELDTFFGIVRCTGEMLAVNGIHNPWKCTAYQKEALFKINTGSLEMSTRGYGSLHFPSMLIRNVSLQGFVVWISFRALWTFNFSFRRWWRLFLCLRCCSQISKLIFLFLLGDQRDRYVDLGVSVKIYSHCIFPLTNLKTVRAVPVATVFESPSRCCRALQYALQYCALSARTKITKKKMLIHRRCVVSLIIFSLFQTRSPFLRAYFLEGLIFWEACIGRGVCVSKPAKLILGGIWAPQIDELAYSWKEIYDKNFLKVSTETRLEDVDIYKTQPRDIADMNRGNQSQKWRGTTQAAINWHFMTANQN